MKLTWPLRRLLCAMVKKTVKKIARNTAASRRSTFGRAHATIVRIDHTAAATLIANHTRTATIAGTNVSGISRNASVAG